MSAAARPAPGAPRSRGGTGPAGATARVVVPYRVDPGLPPPGARLQRLGGLSMGTSWQVRLAAPDTAPLARWQRAIEDELALVDRQMSTWARDSDLSRFNDAPAGSRHRLPAAFAEVLACALSVAADTGGAFDPTAGPLVELWGFGPGDAHRAPGHRAPAPEAIAAARARAGWQRLRFAAENGGHGEAWQPGGLRLDLSAIAKGFAVDRIVERLRDEGCAHALAEVGGELRGEGLKPDGQPWWVELEAPPAEAAAPWPPEGPDPAADAGLPAATRVALHQLAVATSGDYRRGFVDADGQHWAHTLDPRSGLPARHRLASVSVLHASCMWADALSTALTVLGPDAGAEYAARRGIAALFVQRRPDGRLDEQASPALAALAH